VRAVLHLIPQVFLNAVDAPMSKNGGVGALLVRSTSEHKPLSRLSRPRWTPRSARTRTRRCRCLDQSSASPGLWGWWESAIKAGARRC